MIQFDDSMIENLVVVKFVGLREACLFGTPLGFGSSCDYHGGDNRARGEKIRR